VTQFVICPRPERRGAFSYRELRENESVLKEAALALFGNEATVVPVTGGRDVATLFDDAHHAVINGAPFNTTELSRFLPPVLEASRSLAAWWANDWSDLPPVDRIEDAVRLVDEQLRGPVGEVYLLWQRPAP